MSNDMNDISTQTPNVCVEFSVVCVVLSTVAFAAAATAAYVVVFLFFCTEVQYNSFRYRQ